MMSKMRIAFARNYASGGLDVYVCEEMAGGMVRPLRILIEQLPEVDPDLQPTCINVSNHIPRRMADGVIRALLDGLAEAGLIPKMGATEAELVATKRHLQDMRVLALEGVVATQA